jgi:uncharacterized protein YcfJ
MKKLNKIIMGIVLLGMAGIANAGTAYQILIVEEVQAKYKTVNVQEGQEVCELTEVPIYTNHTTGRDASTADVAAGAIIGGIIGNQVGGGSGKDIATFLGAIIGADIANKKGGTSSHNVITGYKTIRQCGVVYTNRQVQHFTGNYIITHVNNIRVRFWSTKPYSVGDKVKIAINLAGGW